MKANDQVGVTFVNTVVGRGALNGVINVSFGVFNFTPSDNGEVVDVDPTIACRLRMDKACAIQLRNAMNDLLTLLEASETPGSKPIEAPASEGIMPKKAAEKMN